jgi:carboxypeptidase Q
MNRALLLLVIGCAPAPVPHHVPAWVSDTKPYSSSASSPVPATNASTTPSAVPAASARPARPDASLAERYREPVAKIIATARADRDAFRKLAYLTDRIGNRFAGSQALGRAIAWAAKTMKDEGFDVRTEKVMVPHWVRGAESGELLTPVARPLHVLGLGGTVGTPRAGITAPVVVVRNFDELEAKRDAVKGAIVLYDVAMPQWTEEKGSGYGETVRYRGAGASRAAKLGAAAVLVRSVTARSLSTLHTGGMRYEDGTPKIPALSITVEDSSLIARLAADGPVTARLRSDAQMLPDVESANVIGELRGSERPDELVVIGAHIDSWDVGQGAHDDGAGTVMMMHALATIKKLGLKPRRTIRVVLFTNEEFGLSGGRAYAEAHAAELPRTVLAVESDSGGFAPRGFSVQAQPADAQDRMKARVTDFIQLLAPINATRVTTGHGGADIAPMGRKGVPLIGLDTDGRTYFDYHHTDADTLDKVDPAALADDVAAVAALAYVAADMPERLDAP